MTGISLRGENHIRNTEVLHKPLHNAARYLCNGGLSCGLSAAAPRLGALTRVCSETELDKPGLKRKGPKKHLGLFFRPFLSECLRHS